MSWAILVARVCQLFPNAAPSTIVSKFFRVYSVWNWPNPVLLTRVLPERQPDVRIWDPRIRPGDAAHRMPIITPAYPSANSSFNVGPSTFAAIRDEIARGNMLLENRKDSPFPFQALTHPYDVERQTAKGRLRLILETDDEADAPAWTGWVESRVRNLATYLESTPGVASARPFPGFVVGLWIKPREKANVTAAAIKFVAEAMAWPKRSEGMRLKIAAEPEREKRGCGPPPAKRAKIV